MQDSVIHALGMLLDFPKLSQHPACMEHAILHGKPFSDLLFFNDHKLSARRRHFKDLTKGVDPGEGSMRGRILPTDFLFEGDIDLITPLP